MKAVFQKEIRQYFTTMAGFVYLSIFLLLSGWYFVSGNLLSANGDIRGFFSSMILIAMFLIPMLTMRSFAEERKMRTDRLLLSAPVSCRAVVLGKFFAILCIFAAGLLVTLLYVAVLAAYGQFDLLVTLGGYCGMLLAAAAFIAVGMLISSLTENQIVAGTISYSLLLGLWLVGFASGFLTNPLLKTVSSYLSLSNRFQDFAMGVFSAESAVYYLSLTALFLFWTVAAAETRWKS